MWACLLNPLSHTCQKREEEEVVRKFICSTAHAVICMPAPLFVVCSSWGMVTPCECLRHVCVVEFLQPKDSSSNALPSSQVISEWSKSRLTSTDLLSTRGAGRTGRRHGKAEHRQAPPSPSSPSQGMQASGASLVRSVEKDRSSFKDGQKHTTPPVSACASKRVPGKAMSLVS